MIQLTFQPALDPFHAVFRLLRILPVVKKAGQLHRDHVRILDFYLLFPFRIDKIRLAPKHQRFKKLAVTYSNTKPYGEQPERELIFDRMAPMQSAAFDTLASYSLIEAEALQNHIIKPTDLAVPAELAERAVKLNADQKDLIEFLGVLATDYELLGPNGLKARTELMEFRYDAV